MGSNSPIIREEVRRHRDDVVVSQLSGRPFSLTAFDFFESNILLRMIQPNWRLTSNER